MGIVEFLASSFVVHGGQLVVGKLVVLAHNSTTSARCSSLPLLSAILERVSEEDSLLNKQLQADIVPNHLVD